MWLDHALNDIIDLDAEVFGTTDAETRNVHIPVGSRTVASVRPSGSTECERPGANIYTKDRSRNVSTHPDAPVGPRDVPPVRPSGSTECEHSGADVSMNDVNNAVGQRPSEGFHAPSVNDVSETIFTAVARGPSEGFEADSIDPREEEHGDNENQSALRAFSYVNGLWPRDQMGPQRGEIKSGLTPNPADGVTTTSNDGYVSGYVSSATAEPNDARQQQQQQPTLLPITEDDNTIETMSPHVTIQTTDGRVMQVDHDGEPTTQQLYEDFMDQPRIQKFLNSMPTTFISGSELPQICLASSTE